MKQDTLFTVGLTLQIVALLFLVSGGVFQALWYHGQAKAEAAHYSK